MVQRCFVMTVLDFAITPPLQTHRKATALVARHRRDMNTDCFHTWTNGSLRRQLIRDAVSIKAIYGKR